MKPWRVKYWIINDGGADFVCAMEAVLDVYERPYNPLNPCICLDESPKQLISEVRHPYMGSDGTEYVDYEYKREGVRTLYMVTEPLGGYREVFVKKRHNGLTYASIIVELMEGRYKNCQMVTLVEDNLTAHKLSCLYEILTPERARAIVERIELVRTPKHGSWLNVAECELSVLTRFGLDKRIATEEELIKQVKAWAKNRNSNQKGVDWQFTKENVKRLYPTMLT